MCPLLHQSATPHKPDKIRSSNRASLTIAVVIACCLAGSADTCAQRSAAATYSRQQLIGLAAQMKMESENNNATNGALERHLDSSTILAVRLKSGRAELHTTSADEFFVVEGHASLLTGGAIVNPSGTAEVRGDSVRGGTRAELKAGDVVHIPANTPHQLLLDNTGPFVYILVKIPAV